MDGREEVQETIEENTKEIDAVTNGLEEPEEKSFKEDASLAKEEKRSRRSSIVKELLIDLLIIILCVMIIPRYVVQRTIVSGSSMETTLQNDDNLLVEKVSYLISNPKRFDVVVFYPYGREHEEYYVKRVIGLPGETIQILGEDIYIDGQKLEEHYGKDPITYQGIAGEALTLGDDEFFLMGDNREVSFDSRYEEIGPISKELIAGKALVRIWPLSKFGAFTDK